MTEKKFVLYDLKITYVGALKIEDFFAEIDKWIRNNGYEREPKKHLEKVTKDGKQIEWLIEAHRHLSDIVASVLIVRALFKNAKDVTIVKNGKRLKTNHTELLVTIDGVLETHFGETWWHSKVIFPMMRTFIDKYIYMFWSFKYDGIVQNDGHNLFKRVRAFLSLQKYYYQETQKLNTVLIKKA